MKNNETLCHKCEECKTHTYERINQKGDLISFKYCNGNKNIVETYDYTISDTNNRINIHALMGRQSKLLTSLIRKNSKNEMRFIDKNRLNLKMNNLQERPRSCRIQEQEGKTSRFLGVVKLKNNKFEVFININGERKYLGVYEKELDAYHHFILKCEEIGRVINKTTESYKYYKDNFNINDFKLYKPKKYTNKIKNVYYRKDSDKYYVLFIKKGKTIFRQQTDNLKEAIRVKEEYLKKR